MNTLNIKIFQWDIHILYIYITLCIHSFDVISYTAMDRPVSPIVTTQNIELFQCR